MTITSSLRFLYIFWRSGLLCAIGAARAPKPDKISIMADHRCCRRCLLFFKIKVRPGSCRSYHIWRPCNWLYPPAQAPTPKIMLLF